MALANVRVRALEPDAHEEIELVARRMRDTLVEVLGEARGGTLYTHDWLVNRVRQHLNPKELTGQVFLAACEASEIGGHTIVRVDQDDSGNPIGLFSTIYVAPTHRRRGIATSLLIRGEGWMLEHDLPRAVTYTDEHNGRLRDLFRGRGYSMSPLPNSFVAFSRALGGQRRQPAILPAGPTR